MSNSIRKNLEEAKNILDIFLSDERNILAIEKAGAISVAALKKNNKIISCGNGGSMSDAMHFAEEMTGRFRDDRKPFAAIAISDPAYITCTANDYGFEHIFSRFVEAHGKSGDVLLAISTSGNSKNILNAANIAKQNGMQIIALTGKDGGKLASACDVEIRAPHSEYADRAQEIHIKVIHALIDFIEQQMKA
ncbi:MAG: Phosphoheptose isomerase [Bacteroidia bacterium]|nr:Phosphoheptose isomerase [Bacteroidia bacterium]